MERINLGGRFRAQADMAAAVRRDRRHARAPIDPEFRIGFAETDRGGPCHDPLQAERRQCCFIKTRRAFEVADADGDVVDHLNAPPLKPSLLLKMTLPNHAAAPDFTSL